MVDSSATKIRALVVVNLPSHRHRTTGSSVFAPSFLRSIIHVNMQLYLLSDDDSDPFQPAEEGTTDIFNDFETFALSIGSSPPPSQSDDDSVDIDVLSDSDISERDAPATMRPVLLTPSHDRLLPLRKLCADLGFDSLLKAAVEDAKSIQPMNKPRGFRLPTVRKDLDELCRAYLDLGAFDHCPKDLADGVADGICAVALGVMKHEFERLRTLESLQKSRGAEWNPEQLASFDMNNVYQVMSQTAPNVIRLLSAFCGPTVEHAESRDSNATKRRIVMLLASIAHLRNNHTNFLQRVFGLFLFASKVPKRVMNCLNHLGFSTNHQTILRQLQSGADAARARLKQLAANNKAFLPVFDNLTYMAKVTNTRIDNQEEFMTMTTGYILIPPASRSPPLFMRTDVRRDKVRRINLWTFLPDENDFDNLKSAIEHFLGETLINFAKHAKVDIQKIDFCLPSVFRIDPTDPPTILPLPTYDLNEAHRDQMIQILYEIQAQTGLSNEQCVQNLVMFTGDLMTVDGIR